MKLAPVANSQNIFWRSLCYYQHIALSFDYGYAARVMNYIEKRFMILTPVANSQNFFWHSLFYYQHIALSFDYGYAKSVTNYVEKKIYEIDTCSQFTKLFLA
jgi:hypothetical protein